jgi:hypothetical protein
MKQIISAIAVLLSMQLSAQNVGIGTSTPQKKLDVAGSVTIRDSLGIGISNPKAPLQFGNLLENRKIVLYDGFGGDNHRFYGFGINGNVLRYQTDNILSDHVFYSALNNVSSRELMRIKGSGQIGIGINNPVGQLSNTANNFAGSDGIGMNGRSLVWSADEQGYVQGIYNTSLAFAANGLAVKIANNTANGRLLDLSVVTLGNTIPVMVAQGDGRVGIGTDAPQQKLDVAGKVTIRDSLGIGISNPNAPLQFGNISGNRKIVLFDFAGNDHQFYGFGINGNALRYQTDNIASDHVFYSAQSNTSSNELMRIKGNGRIGIGTSTPQQSLDVAGNIITSGNFIIGLEYAVRDYTMSSNSLADYYCACSAGKKVIAGGGGHQDYNSAQTNITINFSGPYADGGGWHVLMTNTSGSSRAVQVWAICAKVQ